MSNSELSNLFDIIYNNITSNKAPGLSEYEKSMIFNIAQDQLLKAYFNPRGNKFGEGLESQGRREIDFSSLIKVFSTDEISDQRTNEGPFSPQSNIATVSLKKDDEDLKILFILNEWVTFSYNSKPHQKPTKIRNIPVSPIPYQEYTVALAKAFNRPPKNIVWRLLNKDSNTNRVELIPPESNGSISRYTLRYVQKPTPIIFKGSLINGMSIEGITSMEDGEYECSLDPIMHQELVQRAAELAKAIYQGDLNMQIALGLGSQTELGVTPQKNN